MKKNRSIPFFTLGILAAFLTSCSKTNWEENYSKRSKDPFGTFILYEELPELFDNNEVLYLRKNIHDYLDDIYFEEESEIANYYLIKKNDARLDSVSVASLLNYVAAGNDALISLDHFGEELKDALHFKTKDGSAYGKNNRKNMSGTLTLDRNHFTPFKTEYDRNLHNHYFSELDSSSTKVLGYQTVGRKHNPNFLQISYGDGKIYLHSNPIVFTNYYLLKKPNRDYAAQVLSYLPNRNSFWDPAIRSRKMAKEESRSILKFFWKHNSLKWALLLGFFGLLLFMLFNARRRQRPVPELPELKNATLEFTHTIANLYRQEENHKNIITKKITYFLEKIRTKYLIETNVLNDDFIEKLAAKSGNELSTTRYLINTIIMLNKKSSCSQDELLRLNTLIENFFENR